MLVSFRLIPLIYLNLRLKGLTRTCVESKKQDAEPVGEMMPYCARFTEHAARERERRGGRVSE